MTKESRSDFSKEPRTPWAPSIGHNKGHSRMLSPSPQSTCGPEKLPLNSKHPGEGIELIQCFTKMTKTALFLLNLRFNYRPDSPQQYPGIDFPGEAEEYDHPVGTHSLVLLLKKRNHHPDLPIQRDCPHLPCNAAEVCQPSLWLG